MLRAFSICGLLLLSAPAFAETTTAAAPAQTSEAKKEKLICRREVETGSLVKAKKTCFTKSEWDKIGDAARRNATQMQDDNAGRPTSQ